jgi:hypothetical protein
MFQRFIVFVVLFTCNLALANPPLGFKSTEHLAIGDAVKLQFPDQATHRLHLANGLALTYGEILALGGDFYAVAAAPIALGKTREEQQQRFLADFDTLATAPEAFTEAKTLLDIIYAEQQAIQAGIEHGENPTAVYARINTDNTIRRNCVTGGFCPADHPEIPADVVPKIYFLKQGRYLQLADRDFDHFNTEALTAYRAGHAIAISTALRAHATQDLAGLEKAYAMNAFACHFLSDLFAPGHMRTPRLQLYNTVTPHTVGSLLSNYMHAEDNNNGLMVRNQRGDRWQAYGDAYFMDDRNVKTRALMNEAMQASVDAIFFAFQTGVPAVDTVEAILPDLNWLNHVKENHDNPAPLFFWDAEKRQLLKRKHLNEPQDFNWTAVWFGWETLLELIHLKGLPGFEANALIVATDTRETALEKGLISPQDLQFYNKYQQFI